MENIILVNLFQTVMEGVERLKQEAGVAACNFIKDGMKLGLGLKRETGFGFVKLEYSQTDYDDISVTTSNNTKVTGDIDTDILALSVARSF